MYISELKIHGFKSFAKKEVMKLGEGVTTVVGPNGCGKTNIVDAIRWVLGEQKSRVLRSGKMEDVIFNGADGFKPLNVCTVSLTVHNNSGKLPVEYNDIEIGRRVFRNGESEYTINKTPCRLKDVNDLFLDTGMGADAYSVIELKMIDQILSETGDDRRRMFEEAAGINKYRLQRKSTLRKFEATHFDLERINDIIDEIKQKVQNLDLQLKRFKRHKKLSEKLGEQDIALALLKVQRYRTTIDPLEKQIKEYRHLRESKTTESSIHEKELKQYRETYSLQEKELNSLQTQMTLLVEMQQALRQDILVWTEKGKSALANIDRQEQEYVLNDEKIDLLQSRSEDLEQELTEIELEINGKIDHYKTEKDSFQTLESVYLKTVEDLDSIQNDRWQCQQGIASQRSLYDRTISMVEEKQSLCEKLNERILEQKQNEKIHRGRQKQIDVQSKTIDQKLASSKNNLDRIESKLQILQTEEQELVKQYHHLSAKKDSLESQNSFYQELVESKEGFPEGTRYVLENPKKFPNVLGTVADVFLVDDLYRDALETGLGDLSHCMITKDKKSALSTLENAFLEQAGDLAIIPLKEAIDLKKRLNPVPKNGTVFGRASDLVKTDKKLRPLADYLLGDLLVVENLQDAINDPDLNGWGLVDTAGSYSGSDLILKNRQISEHGNLIGRQEKLDTIAFELNGQRKKEKEMAKKQESLDRSIQDTRKDLKVHLKSVGELTHSLTEMKTNSIRNQLEQSQVLETIKNLEEQLIEVEQVVMQSKESLRSLKPVIDEVKKELNIYQEKIHKANKCMVDARKDRDNRQQFMQDARIALLNLESNRDKLKFKMTSGEETRNELKMRQTVILQEISGLQDEKTDLNEQVKTGEKELSKLTAETQKQKSIIDLKRSVFSDTYQMIDEVQSKITAEQQDRELLLENLKNAELSVSEIEQRMKLVIERIRDRYNIDLPSNLLVDGSENDLKFDIIRIRKSLDNIGPVNMAVQDEYDNESERLEHLQKQSNDLTTAEENLRETIRKIDRVARKRFKETFDLIRGNFEKLFKLFFDGGVADLRLIGDPDPLEADIVIQAQPPGKRNTSLRLLSSGEKALTAISLLFSIYQVKPSPYCILDEVDAPLDDINIHKFTKVLKKFADETQFIIVTHNKLTMEIANQMYGVTQQKKGISQLVSVKFD